MTTARIRFEECAVSSEQAYNEAYDQACAQYERAEKLEVELATERARCVALLQAKTELVELLSADAERG